MQRRPLRLARTPMDQWKGRVSLIPLERLLVKVILTFHCTFSNVLESERKTTTPSLCITLLHLSPVINQAPWTPRNQSTRWWSPLVFQWQPFGKTLKWGPLQTFLTLCILHSLHATDHQTADPKHLRSMNSIPGLGNILTTGLWPQSWNNILGTVAMVHTARLTKSPHTPPSDHCRLGWQCALVTTSFLYTFVLLIFMACTCTCSFSSLQSNFLPLQIQCPPCLYSKIVIWPVN